jgi:thiamine kinase-like enzyme
MVMALWRLGSGVSTRAWQAPILGPTVHNRSRLTTYGGERSLVGVSGDPALESALAALWPGTDPKVTPITAGITNRNFRVDLAGEAFVLRLSGRDTGLLGIDRVAEDAAARAAASAGVGPEVIAFEPSLGASVTRFVEGEPIPEEDLQDEKVLGLVVRSIKAIHSCPPIPSSFPVFRIVEDYAREAAARGLTVPPAFEQSHRLAEKIERAFSRRPMPLTTCHDDLLNANFLRDGDHVWIVDYEYAGMGDPFFDLGNLSINNGLGPEAQEALLGLYFGDVRGTHRARLGLMRIMSDFREAMWGVIQQAISTLEFDYVDYASRHFARLLESATDPRVPRWLEAAEEPA